MIIVKRVVWRLFHVALEIKWGKPFVLCLFHKLHDITASSKATVEKQVQNDVIYAAELFVFHDLIIPNLVRFCTKLKKLSKVTQHPQIGAA